MRQTPAFLILVLLCSLLAACPTPYRGGGGGDDDDDDAADDDDDAGAECFNNEDCDSDEVCVGDDCENASGREYDLLLDEAELTKFGPDGDWDVGAGSPDAYAQVWVDGEMEMQTSTDDDTYFPSWYESTSFRIYSDTEIELFLYDDDVGDDDYICGWSINDPIGLAHIGWAVPDCDYVLYFGVNVTPRE